MIPSGVTGIIREVILPPFSLFALMAIGLAISPHYRRAGRTLAAASMAILFFLCTGIGANALVAPLENLTRAVSNPGDTGARAIVVLAAGRYAHAPEYGGADVPDYIALARLRYAAHLYRETHLPILVSGGNGTPDGRPESKALSMARALQDDFAIPVRWIEPDSENTAENAAFTSRILKREKISRILLVTDAMHMPRSVMAFVRSGIEVVPAPTVFFGSDQLTLLHLLPSAEHLRQSWYALYEWIGLAWYAMGVDIHPMNEDLK